eukprot:120549_1
MDVVVNLLDVSIGSVFNARNAFVKTAATKMNEIFSKHSVSNIGIGINNNKQKKQSLHNKSKGGGMVNVCGIILSGAGPLKSQLYQSTFLKHYILASIMKIMDVNYGGKFGFNETVRKCANLIQQNEYEIENKLIENIFNLMANDAYDNGNIVCIGWNEIWKGMQLNVVKYVVITSGYYKFAVKLMDNKGVFKGVKFVKNENEVRMVSNHMLCDDNGDVIKVVSFMKFWDKLCDERNIELNMVGMHSVLTQQFAKGLSGCVAVLHYPIKLEGEDNDEQYYED